MITVPANRFLVDEESFLPEAQIRMVYNEWLLYNSFDHEELAAKQWSKLTQAQKEEAAMKFDDMRDYNASRT